MARKNKLKIPGFSLIEISISLLIIGLISSIIIPQLNSFLKLTSSQKTQANIDFVVKSLGSYYMNTYKLPCPSKFETNIGEENVTMKNSFGIVPFKTLGIMEKFAKSANGKWLLYKVNSSFGKKTLNDSQRKLGIDEFAGKIADDKVAIIIKSINSKGEDEFVIWISEKNFIANFANNKLPPKTPGQNSLSIPLL